MELNFRPEEEEFRNEVREFFNRESELVQPARREWDSGIGFGPNCWQMLRKIGAKGWLCPTWPKEYGGLELSYMYRYIIMEQMQYFLNMYSTVGAGMAGPVILKQGSDSQKAQYLSRIARGEIEFALGYTEPYAGSDLAALSIHAEDKGSYFLINGSKMFNTRAHYAQYHWLGVRTKEVQGAKHKGISLFIVELNTPGITINPVWTVGDTRTNEVYYDNVEVPKEALVGELNKGFYYIIEALGYERISTVSGLKRDFDELLDYVKSSSPRGNVNVDRQGLADVAIEIEAARLLALKVASMLDKGIVPHHEASMLKMIVSETEQKLIEVAMQCFGNYGQLQEDSKWAPMGGKFEHMYRDTIEHLITRGTSEIIKNIIAQRGLGLPRE